MKGWAKMALVGMILFTAALGAVLHVVALSLWPALPRMAALLAGGEAEPMPVARRAVRSSAVRNSRARMVPQFRVPIAQRVTALAA